MASGGSAFFIVVFVIVFAEDLFVEELDAEPKVLGPSRADEVSLIGLDCFDSRIAARFCCRSRSCCCFNLR